MRLKNQVMSMSTLSNVRIKSWSYPVIGAFALMSVSGTALAQTKIEQMIVTAQKRAQDIQTVPASISAFSGAALERRQIKNLDDLSTATPNFTINSIASGTIPNITVRGVSLDGTAFNIEQSAALHIDGVYQPTAMGLRSTMVDLEAVELLRGPQGTLYGRNANAGVINLITKKPTDIFEASATIFGGNYGHYGARGYVSGPITEGVSMRVTGLVDRLEGYGKNLWNGDTVSGAWTYGGRVAVRLQPTDDVTIDLSAYHEYSHSNSPQYVAKPHGRSGPNFVAVDAYAAAAGNPLLAAWTEDRFRVYADHESESAYQISSMTGTANWDVTPDFSLKSITGWQRAQSRTHKDYDGTATPYILIESLFHSHTFSQEFNANARLWDGRVNLVSGLFYMKDFKDRGGADVYFPVKVAGPPANFLSSGNPLKVVSETKAAFLDVTANVMDDLALIGGIRRTWTTKENVQRIWAGVIGWPPVPSVLPLAGFSCNDFQVDQTFNATTYRGGVQYNVTPDIMGYVTYSTGLKDGGVNASRCGGEFTEETIYSWEFGFKSTLFNGSTTLNANYFDYKYSGLQTTRVITDPSGASFSTIDNVPATIKGAEIELNTWLMDDLNFNAGVGILDAHYGTFVTANSVPTGSNVTTDATGNTIQRAPKLTASASLEYTTRIGDFGELKTRGEYSYRAKTYFDSFEQDYAQQDGFSLWNVIFTFTPDNCENLIFQAWVKNLTDKEYSTGIWGTGTLRGSIATYGPPRTYGGSVTAKF